MTQPETSNSGEIVPWEPWEPPEPAPKPKPTYAELRAECARYRMALEAIVIVEPYFDLALKVAIEALNVG